MTITHEITTRILPLQYTAVVRGEMPSHELTRWLTGTYRIVQEYLRRTRTAAVGAPFARYTFLGDMVAVEAGFPVRSEIAGRGAVQPSTLPSGQAAIAAHPGHHDGSDRTYEAIRDWLEQHQLPQAGPHWEVYYADPYAPPDPAHWRTVVVVPFRQVGAAVRQ